jgi:hypothetical protein
MSIDLSSPSECATPRMSPWLWTRVIVMSPLQRDSSVDREVISLEGDREWMAVFYFVLTCWTPKAALKQTLFKGVSLDLFWHDNYKINILLMLYFFVWDHLMGTIWGRPSVCPGQSTATWYVWNERAEFAVRLWRGLGHLRHCSEHFTYPFQSQKDIYTHTCVYIICTIRMSVSWWAWDNTWAYLLL